MNIMYVTLHCKAFTLLDPKDFYFIWLSSLLTMNVPDEVYYKNASCALN